MNTTPHQGKRDRRVRRRRQEKVRVWAVFVAMVVAVIAMAVGSGAGYAYEEFFGEGIIGFESFDFDAYDTSDPGLTLEEINEISAARMDAFDQWMEGSDERYMGSMGEVFERPRVWNALIAGSQVGLLLVVVVFGLLSKQPFRERLGIKRAGLSGRQWAALLSGMLVPVGVAGVFPTLLQQLFPDLMDMSMFSGMAAMSGFGYLQVAVLITVMPAVCEELLFRGYVQRRLIRWMGGWWAVVLTSVFFALFHISPTWLPHTFVLGIWLGVIAWRTGSTVPCIACHMVANGTAMTMNYMQIHLDMGVLAGWGGLAVLLIIGAPGFLSTVRMLRDREGLLGVVRVERVPIAEINLCYDEPYATDINAPLA